MRDFDVHIIPESSKYDKKNNELKILWPGNVESSYPASWLKSRNFSSKDVKSFRQNIYLSPGKVWNKQEIEQRLQRFGH
uniref:Uncharacterized protein n=1 Tax=Panagrolaimus sp. ES5 TaxID=591445 RepID=A0AC34FYL5_9BILA